MFRKYVVIALFNSFSMRGRSRYTADFDNQIYVPYPKSTATFRTHCTIEKQSEYTSYTSYNKIGSSIMSSTAGLHKTGTEI